MSPPPRVEALLAGLRAATTTHSVVRNSAMDAAFCGTNGSHDRVSNAGGEQILVDAV